MGIFGDAWDWTKNALGSGYNAVTGQSSFQAKPYDEALIRQAQQPWLDGLQQSAQTNVVDPYQQALVNTAASPSTPIQEQYDLATSIDPTRTRDKMERVAGGFGEDVVRRAAGFDALSSEVASAPSYADAVTQAKMGEANSNALARAASTRGANAALQMRETADANAAASRQLISDAAALKANEMNQRFQTRGQLARDAAGVEATGAATQGNLYGGAGNVELAATGQKQGIYQGIGQSNREDVGLKQNAFATAGNLGLQQQQNTNTALGTGANTATQGSSIAAGSVDAANNANAGVQTGNARNKQQTFGGLISGAAGAMFSDIRAKEDIHPLVEMAASPEGNSDALEPVKPYSFRYKASIADALGTDREPRAGVMTRDLKKSPAARDMVFGGAGGLEAIDMPKAVSFNLAANAGLDKRLRLVEEALGRAPRAA